MIICIFGNIGSGKTTVAKSIRDTTSFSYFAIDDYRKRFGDTSITGEKTAQYQFFKSISEKNDFIVECLGVGLVSDQLYKHLANRTESKLIVILTVSVETCNFRCKSKIWTTPVPENFGDITTLINNTDRRLFQEQCHKKWEKLENCKVLLLPNESVQDFASTTAKIISVYEQAN